eukprot:CAMPEP_0115863810 /NCGR_PEP_ID=MMETSP0287-20121206/18876_1 /TAXON_ID=412157 /ORGANISM="Chrysochromulina rotalis, Strain UIO044" /LENGTH=124 /DNA_ID=CAMNT_0003318259 /DNA_START=117 /DNA_END=491 /DNA_ORIENTATION=+
MMLVIAFATASSMADTSSSVAARSFFGRKLSEPDPPACGDGFALNAESCECTMPAEAPTCAAGLLLQADGCACSAVPQEEGEEGEAAPKYNPDAKLMVLFSGVLVSVIGVLTGTVFLFVNVIES